MTLDEQLRALCEQHDLKSISITMYGPHDAWAGVNVQWLDASQERGRNIATSDNGVPIAEGIRQALDRMNAKRVAPVVVPELEAAA